VARSHFHPETRKGRRIRAGRGGGPGAGEIATKGCPIRASSSVSPIHVSCVLGDYSLPRHTIRKWHYCYACIEVAYGQFLHFNCHIIGQRAGFMSHWVSYDFYDFGDFASFFYDLDARFLRSPLPFIVHVSASNQISILGFHCQVTCAVAVQ